MITVALVDLGENLSISVSKLAKTLNSLQRTWAFKVVDAQPNIGNPDDEDIWYRIDRLWLELDRHLPTQEFEFVIGLTHVRLANQDRAVGAVERDYFSLSDRDRLAVITEAMQQWNPQNKDLYQYFSFLIVGELLTLMAKIDLFHQSKELCLFDDCADRAEFSRAIQRGKISSPCRVALQDANVPDQAVKDALRVLTWCRRNTAARAFKMTINDPLVSLTVGTGIGWAAGAFIGTERYRIVGFISLIIVFFIFIKNRLSSG